MVSQAYTVLHYLRHWSRKSLPKEQIALFVKVFATALGNVQYYARKRGVKNLCGMKVGFGKAMMLMITEQ